MAFRFSLATVLQVRDSIEKREELALQKVQFDIANIRHQIEAVTAIIDHKQSEQNRALDNPTPARDLQVIIGEINFSIESRKLLYSSLESLELEQQKRMKAYQAAHAARQMLTEMLDQQRESYDREQLRKEQKALDEVFSARAWRD